MALITTTNLHKHFKGEVSFHALRGIDLRIDPGEFVAIMGPSGSGKSTLLYVLSTLDTDYEGNIIIDQVNLRSLNKNSLAEFRNRGIGFVFQFHYLLPEFTVLENVMLPALKQGTASDEEVESRAVEKLTLLGLEDQALKKASKLSGGQQQRVAIARALINDPKIIFGDEPTGNLDSKNSNLVFDIFTEIKKELKQTIVIVTHDMSLAQRTDRIIKLKDGRIEKE